MMRNNALGSARDAKVFIILLLKAIFARLGTGNSKALHESRRSPNKSSTPLFGQVGRVISDAQRGLICERQDPRALAKIVKQFLQKPEEKDENLGRNGNKYCRLDFTPARVMSRIVELMEKLGSK